ncbi:uncharacterized protein LOC121423111 [Lytechinus variegatus]|uniref:uncharacterized protein LOC121423111 n=1 Tax=Lytechinus variegatus TaxID=7654 RepID=UPI001BB1400F|nr:uncharacterized protein LOC121423111 [Lytechinus variegatus]
MASGQRLSVMSMMNMGQLTESVNKTFRFGQRWGEAKAFAADKPKTALFLLAVFVTFSIPITSFIIVIGSSLFVGLTMLLWIQGAILTTATALLLPTLGFCALIAAGVTVVIHGSRYILEFLLSVWQFIYSVVFPYIVATLGGLTNLWGKPRISELQNED